MAPTQEPAALHEARLVSRLGEEGATGGLRSRTARGVVLNACFALGTSGIAVVQAVLIARLMPTEVLGLWALVLAAFTTLLILASVGVEDKFIQQDDADQKRAFEVAFTVQVLVGVVVSILLLASMPLFALIYDKPEIVLPGSALVLAVPALVLQMPLWTHYRRMDFLRQRKLQLVDPVFTFIATIGLIVAGLEIWGLVIGALTGSYIAAAVILRSSPYRLRFCWDRAALRDYATFSWPLSLSSLSTVLFIQVPIAVASRTFGVTAVAGLALASNISLFTTRVDNLVTQTLYPAICAVKDRPDLLFESFWTSNRLALLWATPAGIGAALFAGDFVHFVVGEKWRFAVPLIAGLGVAAVINQIAFNWTAFFRAVGDTRPVAVASFVELAAVMAIAVPLLADRGLGGFGAGMCVVAAITVAVRLRYMRRLFPGRGLVPHIARGIAPTAPAVVAVLGLREAGALPDSLLGVALEATLYCSAVIACTLASQGRFLRETSRYLRRAGAGPVAAPG